MQGPVEYIVLEFPGNRFSGKIAPALQELVDRGTIRILDLVIVRKDKAGNVDAVELSELGAEEADYLKTIQATSGMLLSEADILEVAEALQNNSTAGVLVWENAWAEKFVEAVANADGRVVLYGRIPAQYLNEALAEAAAPVGV